MNVRKYKNKNWCFFVTNSATDRFRVQTNYKDDEVEMKRQELESLLPMDKEEVMEWLKSSGVGHSFHSLMSNFIFKTNMESGWSKSTYDHFRFIMERITTHYGDITVESCDEEWLYDYVMWRNSEVLNTTLQKEIKSIKQFFKWVEKKYGIKSEVTTTKVKLKKSSRPNVIFLNTDELKKIQGATISKTYIKRTRDLFLFGCFTGMRYSDIQKFNMSNVDGDRIVFTTKKTDDTLILPINKVVKDIIDKYKGNLPKMDIQVYNRFLKELCKEVGIDTPVTEVHYKGGERIEVTKPKYELISSHSARKSFVSNALMLGVPTSVVMSMTGHRSFQSLMSYVAVADSSKREAMSMMDAILS